VVQVVEYLTRKCEALSSFCNTTKKKKKKRKNRRREGEREERGERQRERREEGKKERKKERERKEGRKECHPHPATRHSKLIKTNHGFWSACRLNPNVFSSYLLPSQCCFPPDPRKASP
jgi:hypothetical protein